MKLTEYQQDTLLALGYCLEELHINATSEVSYYDNHAINQLAVGKSSGTGQRLEALARKGLAERVGTWSGRAGAIWELTPEGRKLYSALKKERLVSSSNAGDREAPDPRPG